VPGSRELIDDLVVSHYEALDKDAAPSGFDEAR
jgi:hypothetical protein